VLPKTHLLLLR